jgi:hypothetical protein
VRSADLARGKVNNKELRSEILRKLWVPMEESCMRWLAAFPAGPDRAAAANSALNLVRGELVWNRAKPLYDDGLVARSTSSMLVNPVSPIAAAVILQTVATDVRGKPRNLSKRGAERGHELERQMLAVINPCNASVPSKRLDGSPSSSLQLRASFVLMFNGVEDIVLHDTAVAYVPHSATYACDAILMPAADDAASPIFLLETSVTDPLDSSRVQKVRKWYGPEGTVTTLQAAFPSRKVVAVLVWDQILVVRKISAEAAALSNGKAPVVAAPAFPLAETPRAAATPTAASTAVQPLAKARRKGKSEIAALGAPEASIGDQVVVVDIDGITYLNITT